MRLVKQGKTKKHVAILLVLAMLLTIMPMSVFAEGDDIVQLTVHPDGGDGDVHLEPVECGQIKYRIKSHERDRMACKPAAHR